MEEIASKSPNDELDLSDRYHVVRDTRLQYDDDQTDEKLQQT